jgi:hypothetical protein
MRRAALSSFFCAAFWVSFPTMASEEDACGQPADVDAQMACYVGRYCDDVSTHRARADCYANVIRNLLSADRPPAAPPPPKISAKPAAETNARVTGIATRAYGLRLFSLDNLEVWEEIASSRARIGNGDAVRIVRGSFKSYRMFPERGGLLRVRRLPCGQTRDDDIVAKCRAATAAVKQNLSARP